MVWIMGAALMGRSLCMGVQHMTIDQKKKIQQMRQEDRSYLEIALTLGISKNTIKSYCRRKNLDTSEGSTAKTAVLKRSCEIHTDCKQCGKPLVQGKRGQPKKFCSEECRRTWWKGNSSQIAKKAWYTLTCSMCGKEFESYGNKERKFCDHSCYISYRYNDFAKRKRFEKAGDDHDSRTV